MQKKLLILNLIFLFALPAVLFPQGRTTFSGDPSKFSSELTAFMGPNLNTEQLSNLGLFTSRWDSSAYSKENMIKIIDISSQLVARLMRPVPHFNNYITTLNYFIDYKRDAPSFKNWLTGLTDLTFNKRFTNENIDRFFRNTGLMIKNNVLFESQSVRWKVKNQNLKFLHDTVFYVAISDATLTCYSQKDSTEIYNVTGTYYPELQNLIGTRGKVTFEKAGYAAKDVFVDLNKYSINLGKASFTIDSVLLTHSTYFKKPVLGRLTDQPTSVTNKDKVNYPRFDTYTKEFQIKNIYNGVDYEGGLSFEGANVKGTGENFAPAKINLLRNDTLYIKISSKEYVFSKTGINSQETMISLYMGKDSIFHTNLGFSYFADTRQVNLFRTNNPISKSPYFNSFHNLDMYFEYLSWNMNESKVVMSRGRGASLGQAQFESISFFNSDYFFSLMGIDDYHPLNRLTKFAEYYYSQTFPVTEFARWLNKPVESVTGMCIDLANRGFIFYDRTNNEITIKKKTKDFLDSYAKRKDYDIINIVSQTKAPNDNAILDLKTFDITVNGVQGVFLSDSQRVAIYPYKQQLVIGKNRNIEFDGVVSAGLFTVFGHDFNFSYDTFKIRLQKIDSIKISVETEDRDQLGKALIKEVDNIIQLGTAELYIDNPNNKSGLKSLKQYPIINAITYSYIFYDKIEGLEGIYKPDDFYFKIDPFTYENIDHYTSQEMNLSGEFFGGNILQPMRQFLSIQENNSLGFKMVIPEEGIDLYAGKGRLYDSINMSNNGLIGSGTLKHLTSTTRSAEYKFFPDSMITQALTFNITKDEEGVFPSLTSENVSVKWLTKNDEWLSTNATGKYFNMFENGTTLDGSIKLTPSILYGSGAINMSDSRINSDLFSFASNSIRADTADYNLKSLKTSGYSFIAENAKTIIDFNLKNARFSLNTDSSVVKFPEIQYICKMTDFDYNMDTRILDMEQKGKTNIPLLSAENLLKLNFGNLDQPTFFATNSLTDTVSFSAWKGSYHLDQEYIKAENINYIPIADALIQPDSGKIIINRRAQIQTLQNATLAINNKHILHSAKVDIESTKRYTGSAVYDYVDDNKAVQFINFPELRVDTLTSFARGYIPVGQNFMLNSGFTFTGDVTLSANDDILTFTGAAGIVQNCSNIKSYSLKFKSKIDPKNTMIPISEKPRDMNDNPIFSGSHLHTDSTHIYPAFLSAQKAWSDVALINSNGFLYFDRAKGRYVITSLQKIVDPTLSGNMIAFDKNYCTLTSEGNINLGGRFDLVKLSSAGKIVQSIDSGKVNIESLLGLDFHFSPEAIKSMADEFRMIPSLKPVNLNSDIIRKGMNDLLGVSAAAQIKEEIDLFGTSRILPKEFTYELLLNDVKLKWDDNTSSYRSSGKIGIGFIGSQPVNVYVDGYIEIQRRRSGDLIDIYLKADESTWYYFSYIRGVMMSKSSNSYFNNVVTNTKESNRKHPEATGRVPYTYVIAADDRLKRFLRRMTGEEEEVNTNSLDGLIR